MVALTDDVYEMWVETLQRLVAETSDRLITQVSPTDPDALWIKQLWPANAKSIDFATASVLCGKIGLVIPIDLAETKSVCLQVTDDR